MKPYGTDEPKTPGVTFTPSVSMISADTETPELTSIDAAVESAIPSLFWFVSVYVELVQSEVLSTTGNPASAYFAVEIVGNRI